MKRTSRELEVKLQLPADRLRDLKKMPIAGTTETSPPSVKELASTYFDTKSWSLRAKGYSFRIRNVDGRWIQTVKSERAVRGGVSNPREVEGEIDGAKPRLDAIDDKDIRSELEAIMSRTPLQPVFDTVVKRTSRQIETGQGDTIELAIDEGHVVTRPTRNRRPSKKAVIREVELELKTGSSDGILAVLDTITAGSPFKLVNEGKADAGFRLCTSEHAPPQVAKGKVPVLEKEMSGRGAVRAMVEVTAAQILANWLVVLDREDPEGVHQFRVGLRRLRSVLRLMRYGLDDQTLRGLDAELRDLARAAGEVRDLDVLATDLVEPLAGVGQFTSGIDEIRRSLTALRKQAREKLLRDLDEHRHQMLRVRLGLLPQTIDRLAPESALDQPVDQLASRALAKLTKRALKRGEDIANATVEQRHDLRKALKSARYAAEFFGALYNDDELKHYSKCSAELQDLLGYHNDVTLAGRLTELVPEKSTQTPDVGLAVGAIIGWHSARDAEALERVASAWKRWKKLAKTIPG